MSGLTTRWSRPGQLRQNEFEILSKRWPGGSSRGRWAADQSEFRTYSVAIPPIYFRTVSPIARP